MKTMLTGVGRALLLAGFFFAGIRMSRDWLRANASKHKPAIYSTIVSSNMEKRLQNSATIPG